MSLDGQQASGGGTGPLAHCEASRRGGDGRGCEVSRVRQGGEVGLLVPAAWASSERGGTAVQASGALAPRVRAASRAVRPASHAWRRWHGDRAASGGWGRSGMAQPQGTTGGCRRSRAAGGPDPTQVRDRQISVETDHRTDETETEIVGFSFSLQPIGCDLLQNRSFPRPNNQTELSV